MLLDNKFLYVSLIQKITVSFDYSINSFGYPSENYLAVLKALTFEL